MAVIVKYVVERNGEEKMTFTSKAEADAYDKNAGYGRRVVRTAG